MAASTRESRRRKIIERGSDRLALITRRIPDPPSQPPVQPDSNLPPPLVTLSHDQDPPPNFSSQAAVSPDADDKAFSPVLNKDDPTIYAGQSQISCCNDGIVEESVADGDGTSSEPSKDPALDANSGVNSLPVPVDDRSSFISTSGARQHSETQTRQNFFSSKQISSAIDASEKTRLLCSVIVAILVVLSHLGFPLPGNRFLGSIISFRPLYFILLTNLTVVIARILLNNHIASGRANREENKITSADDNNWAEQLSKTLEAGLLVQKAVDAVFMDCSIYAIIVICGLSLT